jgi:hypothetical protein
VHPLVNVALQTVFAIFSYNQSNIITMKVQEAWEHSSLKIVDLVFIQSSDHHTLIYVSIVLLDSDNFDSEVSTS